MTETAIASDAKFVRTSDVVSTDMDGETVMMDVENGEYFALSGSGPLIWEKLAEPMRVDEIIAAIGEEFDTSGTDDLEGLITGFVSGLLGKGLIQRAD